MKAGHLKKGSISADLPGHQHGLLQTHVMNAAAKPVQVGDLQLVKISDPQLSKATLHSQGQRIQTAQRRARSRLSFCASSISFSIGDLVFVAVGP